MSLAKENGCREKKVKKKIQHYNPKLKTKCNTSSFYNPHKIKQVLHRFYNEGDKLCKRLNSRPNIRGQIQIKTVSEDLISTTVMHVFMHEPRLSKMI